MDTNIFLATCQEIFWPDILKAWLPNVKILAPEELKQEFIADMRGWLRWLKER
jgi:hypothetical protein